jgi:hypothetical protein
MDKMIAFCGLVCTECPAFTATQNDDNEARRKLAESWSCDQYPLTLDDINCGGCLATEGRLIKFCEDCEVRFCGFDKNVKNCAHCDEFPCAKLERIWEITKSPDAKARLEEIRKTL